MLEFNNNNFKSVSLSVGRCQKVGVWVGGGGALRHIQLFNDALNAFYLRLYRVRHMVKDHSDSERGNPLLFPISRRFFYMHRPTDGIIHTTAFVTPVVEHWLERGSTMKSHVKQ